MLSNKSAGFAIAILSCINLLVLGISGEPNNILPPVGFGTAGLQSRTQEAVFSALTLGVRMIDSAQAQEWYDEEGVGIAVSEFEASTKGSPIIIVTKVHPRSFGDIRVMDDKLAASKRNFHRDNLDLVLLHAPWCWAGHCTAVEEAAGWETGWNNLMALRSKHNIKAVGVSNFHLELLQRLVIEMGQKVDVVQNWMDPFHQDVEVREFCAEHNIQYMAYSSFGSQWNRNPNPVLTNNHLRDIADAHRVSVPQVVMAWLAASNVVAIPRTSSVAHMKDNFAELIRAQDAHNSLHSQYNQCMASAEDGDEVTIPNEEACKSARRPTDNLPTTLSWREMHTIESLDGSLGTPWD